jgi:hypothetical protein
MAFGFVRTLGNENATCATHGSCQVRQEAFLFIRPCELAACSRAKPVLFPLFPALGAMYFCMFQEVMFVSLKYAILASPGLIVSTPSCNSQDDFRRLNRLRTWPALPIWRCGCWVSGQQLECRESETHPRHNPQTTIGGRTLSVASADKLPIVIPPQSTDTFNGRLHACRGGRCIAG